MPQVPNKEAEFISLADTAFRGFIDHPTEFPEPPVTQAEFAPKMNSYYLNKNAIANAEQVLKEAIAEKQSLLDDLRMDLVRDLRYAERITKDDPTKLSLVGWGPRKTPEPIPLPGTPSDLAASSQGRGSVTLTWKRTTDSGSGAAAYYVVERRVMTPGQETEWTSLCSSMTREVTLTDQPMDVEILYRVYARNTSGVSAPSSVVQVVL